MRKQTYTEEQVARLQATEVKRALEGLLIVLTEGRNAAAIDPEHVRTMRQQGVIYGLDLAISAIKGRIY